MAFDAYLKIEGVEGEVTQKGHEGSIEILSWSWGAHNAGSFGSPGGDTTVSDFHFTHKLDKATPVLLNYACTGKHIPKAILTVRKSAQKQDFTFLKITFDEYLISRLKDAENEMGPPMEEVSFNFSKVEYDYRIQKPDGTLGSTVHGECQPVNR